MELNAEQIKEKALALKKEIEEELFQKFSPLKGRKLEPKYRDPETGKTWAGRGRLPKFLVGKDKEAFRI